MELQTIVDISAGVPTIDPFFGPTRPDRYWSASTVADFPLFAWDVDFSGGIAEANFKDAFFHVRAVRGGP